MKKIKFLYDLVFFILGKDVASKHPPEQVDLVFYQVILTLFNQLYQDYVSSEKVDRRLDPFKRNRTETLVNGQISLHSEIELIRPPLFASDKITKIDLVPDLFWHHRRNRVIGAASASAPIAKIEYLTNELILEVYPEPADKKVIINYFKKPVRPKYAYTISGSRYVYDDVSSVDYEFTEMMIPQLAVGIVKGLGYNIREEEVVQYMNEMEINQK